MPGCLRHCLTAPRTGTAGAGPGLHARDRALASAPGGPTEERDRSPCRRGAGEDAVRQWRGQPARGVLGRADGPPGRVQRSQRPGAGCPGEGSSWAGFGARPCGPRGFLAGASVRRLAGPRLRSRRDHK